MSLSLVEWGSAASPLADALESGDRPVVAAFENGVLAGVIDGLGHGPEAAEAAGAVAALLESRPGESLRDLFRRCHEGALKTRGSVMSLASFNGSEDTMSWAGVGNVEGLLLRADPSSARPQEELLLSAGGVGFQFPDVRRSVLRVFRGDTLVLFSDGVNPGFAPGLRAGLAPAAMARDILDRYNRDNDDALVLVVRYLGHTA